MVESGRHAIISSPIQDTRTSGARQHPPPAICRLTADLIPHDVAWSEDDMVELLELALELDASGFLTPTPPLFPLRCGAFQTCDAGVPRFLCAAPASSGRHGAVDQTEPDVFRVGAKGFPAPPGDWGRETRQIHSKRQIPNAGPDQLTLTPFSLIRCARSAGLRTGRTETETGRAVRSASGVLGQHHQQGKERANDEGHGDGVHGDGLARLLPCPPPRVDVL
jgi:hypothetical protein